MKDKNTNLILNMIKFQQFNHVIKFVRSYILLLSCNI